MVSLEERWSEIVEMKQRIGDLTQQVLYEVCHAKSHGVLLKTFREIKVSSRLIEAMYKSPVFVCEKEQCGYLFNSAGLQDY